MTHPLSLKDWDDHFASLGPRPATHVPEHHNLLLLKPVKDSVPLYNQEPTERKKWPPNPAHDSTRPETLSPVCDEKVLERVLLQFCKVEIDISFFSQSAIVQSLCVCVCVGVCLVGWLVGMNEEQILTRKRA